MTASTETTPLVETGRTRTAQSSLSLRRAAIAVAGLAAVACVGVIAVTSQATPMVRLKAISADQQTALLNQHNAYRCMHGSPPLTFDPTLAAQAQKWADTLATQNGCTMKHSRCDAATGTIQTLTGTDMCQWGENLAWASNPTFYNAFPPKFVDAWYDEISNYKYDTATAIDPAKPVGHFTQVVWKGTTRVGCGAAECAGAVVTACQYMDPGNIIGQYQTNVVPPTKSEAECKVVPEPKAVCPTISDCKWTQDVCMMAWSCGGGSYTCGDVATTGCTGKVDPALVMPCELADAGTGCNFRAKRCANVNIQVTCTIGRGGPFVSMQTTDDYTYKAACAGCKACVGTACTTFA